MAEPCPARASGPWPWLLALAGLLVPAGPSAACNIPLFRVALEKWDAVPYQLLVFHPGPLAPADKAVVDALARGAEGEPARANARLRRVDLAGKPGPEALKLLAGHDKPELPLLVVRYPLATKIDADVWAGRLSAADARAVLDSPARREAVRRIQAGESAVWLLLEGGDRKKDDAAAALLKAESDRLTRTLKLPKLTDAPADKLAGGPALRVAFSVLRVARTDPAERVLVRMLLGLEDDLAASREPMAFAVYGRGRALLPMVGKGINPDVIGRTARFLVAPCTCDVTSVETGVPLLVTADWEGGLGGRVVPDRQPPELTGMSHLVQPNDEPEVLPMPKAADAGDEPNADEAAGAPSRTGLVGNVVVAVVGGVVVVAVLAWLLLRPRARPRG